MFYERNAIWLSGQSAAIYKRDILSSDVNGVLFPYWRERAIVYIFGNQTLSFQSAC